MVVDGYGSLNMAYGIWSTQLNPIIPIKPH